MNTQFATIGRHDNAGAAQARGVLLIGRESMSCVVCSVSAGGACVEVGRQPPLFDDVTLRLVGHGEAPARVIWREGRQMGLMFDAANHAWVKRAFAGAMNTAAEAERRGATRVSVLWSGRLEMGARTVACLVVCISTSGARVRVPEPAACSGPLTLHIDRRGSFCGEPVWRGRDELAIQFHGAEREIAAILAKTLGLARACG